MDDDGGGGRRGFSARGGGDVAAAESRFWVSACPANASLSVVRLEMNDLTFVLNMLLRSVSSR